MCCTSGTRRSSGRCSGPSPGRPTSITSESGWPARPCPAAPAAAGSLPVSSAQPRYHAPHCRVRISALALLKMAMHARSGGELEVMGVMQGKVLGDTFVVMDAFPLPVEGTETRVNAQSEAYEYMVDFLETNRVRGGPSWGWQFRFVWRVCSGGGGLREMSLRAGPFRNTGTHEDCAHPAEGPIQGPPAPPPSADVWSRFDTPLRPAAAAHFPPTIAWHDLPAALPCRQASGREENIVGWYHSHPGYGCWLSGIDVGTQLTNQKYQEPFLAVVVDPKRTEAAGKVELGAFRTYPEV